MIGTATDRSPCLVPARCVLAILDCCWPSVAQSEILPGDVRKKCISDYIFFTDRETAGIFARLLQPRFKKIRRTTSNRLFFAQHHLFHFLADRTRRLAI